MLALTEPHDPPPMNMQTLGAAFALPITERLSSPSAASGPTPASIRPPSS
jgi:hypothetical protein